MIGPRKSSIGRMAVMAATLSIFGGAVVNAQVESGSVVGTVRDASGAVLPDAVVTVSETGTNTARKVTTGANGDYAITELQPGTYRAMVEHGGFKRVEAGPFKLDVNQVVRADIKLTVGSVQESMVVAAVEPLIESETSSLGQVIEQSRVNDLPLNGRNFIQLAYLAPGVNGGPQGIVQQGGIPENERGDGAIQVNGLTATNNNFLLNGFDNNEQQIGFEVIQPAVDAIEEFKVQTNNFGADIGKGGAVVNVVLKSGSNKFHGGVYEFLRNSALDAKNYFDLPGDKIVPFKQNQFGGTFGGALRKDKTFFFGDYQGTRIRQAQTDSSTIPNQPERSGNFADLCSSGFDGSGVCLDRDQATGTIVLDQIYNPCNPGTGIVGVPCTVNTGNRLPFPNNQIPLSALDPAAQNVLSLYPAAPNVPGSADQFLYNPVAKNNQDSFDIRIDHQLTAKDNLFGFFSYGKVNSVHPDPLPGLAGGGGFSGIIKNKSNAIGISDVHTFSDSKVNEFKIGYMRYEVNAVSNFSGQAVAQNLGIPGINDPSDLVATGGLTNINIPNLASLGNICCFPEFLKENNYQVLDAFTYIRGRHIVKVGGDLKLRQHGFFQALNPTGVMNFDQGFTADTNNPDNTGNSLASFELGLPIFAARDLQKQSFGMSWWEISGYAMGDYRVTRNLTLNLGVRYDVYTPMVEDRNRLANFDFATGVFLSPRQSGVSRSGNVVTDRNNFAPRVGFAYTPWDDNKTVLRGGYGIFYDMQADQSDTELAFNPTGIFSSQSLNFSPTSPGTSLSNGVFTAPSYPLINDPQGRTSATPFNTRTPYIQEWNMNIERALAKNLGLQVAYVGTRGVKLAFLSNQNQPVQPLDSNFCAPTPSGCDPNEPNAGRPYAATVPNVAGIRTETHESSSTTHSLQVKLEKRFSAGWTMLNAYTWQHTLGQVVENEALEPQNTHNLAAERGNNAPDFRHQFTSAWSYELPIGPGKRFMTSSGLARWIVGGWQVNGILVAHTGEAVTPLMTGDFSNTGSFAYRPDQIADPYRAGPVLSNPDSKCAQTVSQGGKAADQVHTLITWYNPCAFALPPNAPGQNAHLFGNARRGSLRGPGAYNIDLSLFKDFKFNENRNLQFRLEAFNLFNHAQYANPSNSITSPADAPGDSGKISSTSASSRQVQLALKFSF